MANAAFYTYLYRDIDGTPIYVGKGKGNRAWNHFQASVKTHLGFLLRKRLREGIRIDPEINYHVSEEVALATEVQQILFFGRVDLKTGTLFNLTDGGDGTSGCIWTDERRAKTIASLNGIPGTGKKAKGMIAHNKGTLAVGGNAKGHEKQKTTCPHCGILASSAMLSRWHFEKCKERTK